MSRGVVNEILRPYLKENIDLETHFRDGVFTFRDLVLKEEAINKKLGSVNLTCRFAKIDVLTVTVPYDLENEDVEVVAEGLTVFLSTSADADLFRSSMMGQSMMADSSIMGSSSQYADSTESSLSFFSRDKKEEEVYWEFQETIADLMESLRLRVKRGRVLLENDGFLFDATFNDVYLFNTKKIEQKKNDKNDEKNPKNAKNAESDEYLTQKAFRIGGLCVSGMRMNMSTLDVSSSGASCDEMLAQLDGQKDVERFIVLEHSVGNGDDGDVSLLFFEYGVESVNVVVEMAKDDGNNNNNNATTPLLINVMPQCVEEIRKMLKAISSSSSSSSSKSHDDLHGESFRASGNNLSDFSMLLNKSGTTKESPLHMVSVFSDWSVLDSLARTSSFSLKFGCPLIKTRFNSDKSSSTLTIHDVKFDFAQGFGDGQRSIWKFEMDNVMELVCGEKALVTMHPAALSFVVRGETVVRNDKVATLLTLESIPRLEVGWYPEAFQDIVSIFATPGNMAAPAPAPATEQTYKVEWQSLCVRVAGHVFMSSGGNALYVSNPSQRVRLEASSFEILKDDVELLNIGSCRLGVSWNPSRESSIAPLIDVSKLFGESFGGLSMVWGSQLDGYEVSTEKLPKLANDCSLRMDFSCQSMLLNLEQSSYHALLKLIPPSDEIQWISLSANVNNFIASLTHESGARFDYGWTKARLFTGMGLAGKDYNFLMLDGDSGSIFVTNPKVPQAGRALLWQLIGAQDMSQLDTIELSNLSTVLGCSLMSVESKSGMRISVQNSVVSTVWENWNLCSDFWTDYNSPPPPPALESSPDEQKWTIKLVKPGLLLQSRLVPLRSHVIVSCPKIEVVFSFSQSAMQISVDMDKLQVHICNSDSLPTFRGYLSLAEYVENDPTKVHYARVLQVGPLNMSYMKDDAISVGLVNMMGNTLEVRGTSDALSLFVVFLSNWSKDAAMLLGPSPFGQVRALDMSQSEGGLLESSYVGPAAAKEVLQSIIRRPAPKLNELKHGVDVRLYLLEVRDEYKAGSTVRVRWEYQKGIPSEYDWIALYKTTRSPVSTNFYESKMVEGKKFGMLEWKVPSKMGYCHFRFFRGSGTDRLVATSEEFRIGPLVKLAVTRVKNDVYVERKVIQNDKDFNWTPKNSDTIGLYKVRETNKNKPYLGIKKQVGDAGDISKVSFEVPHEPGRYDFRYFADMGWGQTSELARSAPFEVDGGGDSHELVGRKATDRNPKVLYQVSEFRFKWIMVSGSTWETPQEGDADELELEVVLPVASYAVMHSDAKHKVQVHVTCSVIELHDRVVKSNYRSVLCFPAYKRPANSPCIQVQLGKQQAQDKWDCRVDVAPLWLNVDQDSLIFLLRFTLQMYEVVCSELQLDNKVDDEFMEQDPMMQSFVLMPDQQQQDFAPTSEGPSFGMLSVSAVHVEIDFRAKGRRMDTVLMKSRRGRETLYEMLFWLSGLLSFNESQLSLEPVLLRDIPCDRAMQELSKVWFPQIEKDNVTSLLAGFEPIKFVFRIGDASISMVQNPIAEYQQGGNVISGLVEGGSNLGKTIYVETFRGLSNLLVGTGNVLRKVDRIAEGSSSSSSLPITDATSSSTTTTHVKSSSPNDMREGFAMATQHIVRGVQDGLAGVFVAPVVAYQTGSATDAAVQVLRGMPGLVLKPLKGLLWGSSIPLRRMASALDPTIQERATLKYKRPAEAAKEKNESSGN